MLEPLLVDRAEEKADFHWLTRNGERLSGSEQELRAALSSGALGAETLVWRKGWAEWQSAQRVVELATSLPAPVFSLAAPSKSFTVNEKVKAEAMTAPARSVTAAGMVTLYEVPTTRGSL